MPILKPKREFNLTVLCFVFCSSETLDFLFSATATTGSAFFSDFVAFSSGFKETEAEVLGALESEEDFEEEFLELLIGRPRDNDHIHSCRQIQFHQLRHGLRCGIGYI